MSNRLTFAYPGNLDLKTGGYAYDRRIMTELRALGWQVDPMAFGEGFPFPSSKTLSAAEAQLSTLADGSLVVIDGLAFGVLDGWARRHADRLRIVALVHHPLALETGLDTDRQRLFRDSEIRALALARHVIVTSPATARELKANYGLTDNRITIALPGTDKAEPARGIGDPPRILSIGTLSRRKGHDILIDALKQIEDLDWRADIVGSRDLDPDTSRLLETQIERLHLRGRVTLVGEVADTRAALASADIFALASRYEGYGMVFAEALSQGLPIVACHAGAVPDVVPENAGILVPVDDTEAFAAALRRLLTSDEDRAQMARAAAQAGAALPGWDDSALSISRALERLS